MTQTERRQELWECVHDCQWATNRTDPQWRLSITLDVPLQLGCKTPGESSVNITVCSYNTTHLQENPQRLGWGFWRDVLHCILSLYSLCQDQHNRSYTSVFKYYFSNTWTGLGRSGASLCSSRVEIELFPYTIPVHSGSYPTSLGPLF